MNKIQYVSTVTKNVKTINIIYNSLDGPLSDMVKQKVGRQMFSRIKGRKNGYQYILLKKFFTDKPSTDYYGLKTRMS